MLSRLLLVGWLLVAGCATGFRYEYPDECPNPTMESMAWKSVQGSLVEVIDAGTFRLRADDGPVADDGAVLTVTIASVGEPYDTRAAEMLRRMLNRKRLTVFVNLKVERPTHIIGEVQVGTDTNDIARRLLRAGAVAFKEPPAYTISGYSECLHRIAEREAKAARIGIWRN